MPQLVSVATSAPVAQFPFDRAFQIGVLGLMAQRFDFLLTAVELFQPEYFEDKILVWVFQAMKAHHARYQELPVVDPVLSNEFKKAVRTGTIKPAEMGDYGTVLAQMRNRVTSQQYKIDEVIRFCRRQAGRKMYLETAPLMDMADDAAWDVMVERMHQIVNIGSHHIDIGTNYFRTAKERARRRHQGDSRRIHSIGIPDVDLKTGGGVKDGQLAMWLGGTGRGKSIALCHCGQIAVGWGRKVAHYTLELDEHEVSERYDAAYTRIPIHELGVRLREVEQKFGFLESKYGDQLMIKAYPTRTASVNTIKSHLQHLAGIGWVPDFIIVDYGDLLKPLTNYQDEYADLGAIFADLRGLAGEMGVPVWTATQANRSGLNADVVDLEHIGDSIKKAQIADLIIALCAKREEIDAGIMRLFGAKNRNGPDKWEIKIGTAYEMMTLYEVVKNAQLAATGGLQTQSTVAPGMPPQPHTSRRAVKV
jgi:replicative DNA helicase